MHFFKFCRHIFAAALIFLPGVVGAEPFAKGWQLQPGNSVLSFQTITDGSNVELMSFLEYSGRIDEQGHAEIRIGMDSVTSGIDLRDVRVRFLLFETFNFPQSVVSLKIPPEVVADLRDVRRKRVQLPFTLEIAGVRRKMTAHVIVTLIDYNTVAVASAYPIALPISTFFSLQNMNNLEETGEVDILPSASVSFNFAFGRREPLQETLDLASLSSPSKVQPAAARTGPLSLDACRTRFNALSRTGKIRFATGSSRLTQDSYPLLNTLSEIITRCPDMALEVGGHTDATGDAAANKSLSRQRAGSVAEYLSNNGIATGRMRVVGYGETRPIADNTTAQGRRDNRRIEFTILSGT